MKRFKTDFLYESPSFLAGVGSVLNIRGRNHKYNESNDPDTIALSHDWHIVGQDMQDALRKADAAFRQQPSCK
jgi:hypothetical protein